MRHHELALAAFVRSIDDDPAVVGVILTGSVALGAERTDSDVDVYLVVTEERWADAVAQQRIMYVDRHDVDYPGGYLDVKLISLPLLRAAAAHGDEPLRASLLGARVVLSRAQGLEELAQAAAVLPDAHFDDQMLAQLAQVRLHAGYFLAGADRDGDGLLARSAAAHALLAAHRALLARARRLHRGPKYLAAAVAALPDRPPGWNGIVARLLADPRPADGERLIAALDEHCGSPLDDATALSRFVLDTEYAWSTGTPVPEYS